MVLVATLAAACLTMDSRYHGMPLGATCQCSDQAIARPLLCLAEQTLASRRSRVRPGPRD